VDREFLLELAYILSSSPTHEIGDSRNTRYIKIEENTAKEIAHRLREIADRLPNITH
jgi:hypothetical protein